MNRNNLLYQLGLALVPLGFAVSTVFAASDLSDPLTSYTGDSTQPGTQAALNAAGFNFDDTSGLTAVSFDSNGAAFDALALLGNEGRNYLRTNQADFANHGFVAQITISTPMIDDQDAYFGMGSGIASVPDGSRTPDWLTPNASVMYWGENEFDPLDPQPTVELYGFNDGDTIESEILDPATGLGDGTHRVRFTYNWYAKTALFEFDLDSETGAFNVDLAAPLISVMSLYNSTGWPTEASRIFFGGDEGVTFKNFSVDVNTPALTTGDFNGSSTVNQADWAIFRANQHGDLVGLSSAEAYLRGDMNGDGANDHADFALFKFFYDEANGSGSFAQMVASVPEPSSVVLMIMAAGLLATAARRGLS